MAASTLVDLVQVYSTTVGTGTLTLGTAVQGYLSPSTVNPPMSSGSTVSYAIFDGPNSEVGQGTLTLVAGLWTLSRGVTQSTNNHNPINCSGNNQIVAFTLRAEDLGAATVVPFQAGVSTGGNTAGTTGLVNAAMVFVGLGALTLSQSIAGQNATLSLSAAAGGGAATGNITASGNTTGATSSTTLALGSLTLSGSGGVSVGLNGQTIIIAGATTAAQTIQTQQASVLGATTGLTSSSILTLSSMAVSAAGGMSIGLSAGTMVFSAPTTAAQTVQQLSGSALGNTTGATSSSLLTLSTLALSAAGGLSIGINAGTWVLSGATTAAQTIQTGNLIAVGNTTAATSSANFTLSQLTISAAGGASVGFQGGSIIVSAATGGGGGGATGVSATAVGQTTGATSSATIAFSGLSFSGAGGVSVGYGAGGQVVISGATTVAQSIQTAGYTAVGNTTLSTSLATASLSSLAYSGAGGVSVGLSGGTVIISGATTAAQSVQTANLSAAGNTAGSTSSTNAALSALTFLGSGGASVGFSGGSIVIAAAAAVTSLGLLAVSNTTAATSSTTAPPGGVTFAGAGGVSVGFSAGSVVISGGAGGGGGAATESWFVAGAASSGSTTSQLMPQSSIAFSGANGINVGFSNGTVVIGDNPQGFWEVRSYSSIVSSRALSSGSTHQFVQGPLPFALSFNQARFFVNLGQTLGTSSTNAASVTTSGSLGFSLTLGVYQPVASNSNSFTLLTSSSMSMGVTQSLTQNLASQSNALTYNFMSGTNTSSTTFSLSSSTATAPTGSSLFTGFNEIDIPFGPMGLPPGNYMFGLRASSAAAAFGAMNWSFSEGGGVASYINLGNFGAVAASVILPGVGTLGSAAFVTGVDWRSIPFVNAPFYVALMSQ